MLFTRRSDAGPIRKPNRLEMGLYIQQGGLAGSFLLHLLPQSMALLLRYLHTPRIDVGTVRILLICLDFLQQSQPFYRFIALLDKLDLLLQEFLQTAGWLTAGISDLVHRLVHRLYADAFLLAVAV